MTNFQQTELVFYRTAAKFACEDLVNRLKVQVVKFIMIFAFLLLVYFTRPPDPENVTELEYMYTAYVHMPGVSGDSVTR